VTLTSSILAEKMNQHNLVKGSMFLPFAEHHARMIEPSGQDVLVFNEAAAEMMVAQAAFGPAVTWKYQGRVAAIFGFVEIWNGLSEAWLIADDTARRTPLAFTKTAIFVLDIAQISMRLHRLQITVRTTDKRAEKWARAIGFEPECVMRKYGPDQVDYFLMARF
jgi:hypothetical protein